jgi:cob(I)alamin adenosyltransferase
LAFGFTKAAMNSSNKYQIKTLAFVGDGEGKTSAAIGHAIRAAGHGKKTAIIQFLKGRINTGEYLFIKKVKDPLIEIYLSGDQTFLMPDSDKTKHIQKAKEGIALANKLISSNKYFLIILDEILDAQAAGLIGMEDIISIVWQRHGAAHIILTGRILPPEISPHIDLITRMQKIKHYFDKDENGIEGLDW